MHQESTQTRVVKIGPDRVTVTEAKVVIEARHEMPDWKVREFKVIPIFFENRKYYLVQKSKVQPPYAFRYTLLPWPEDGLDTANLFQTYDAEAVAERDSVRRSDARSDIGRALLLLFYPFLGLLWSKTQRRLSRFGFAPRSITVISIWTTFMMLLVEIAFTPVINMTGPRDGSVTLGGVLQAFVGDRFQLGPVAIPMEVVDFLLTVAFLVDASMRFTYSLREDQWTGGFLEWLLPRRSPKL
jgi:hypothetical protein